MSEYRAIARKYRPQQFKDVIYQPHIVKILQNSLKSGKIHHSYIFSGMRGVGKTSVARIFAKALNCKTGVVEEPCNKCSNCIEITEGNFPDVIEIDGASNRGIDQVRELREIVKYKPIKGRFKVIIIDEVHMLTNEAFNALLKTLEEPPEHTVFILATTEFHKVLPTVISRSITLDFRRIPFSEIKKRLRFVAEEEKIEVSEWALGRIAEVSEGSMRDALSIFEQIASYSNKVKDDDLNNILGIINEDLLEESFLAVFKRDKIKILKIVENLFVSGEDFYHFYKQFFEYLRNFLFFKETGNFDDSFSEREKSFFEKNRGIISSLTLLRLLNILEKYEYSFRKSLNKRYLLEIIFLNLIYAQEAVDLNDIVSEGESGLKKNDTTESPKKDINEKKDNINPDKKEIIDKTLKSDKPSELLELLIEEAQESESFLYNSLKDVVSVSIDKNNIIFVIPGNRKATQDILMDKKDDLLEIIKKVTGKTYIVKTVLEKSISKKNSIEEITEDPKIKDFLDLFKGEIIEIKKGG